MKLLEAFNSAHGLWFAYEPKVARYAYFVVKVRLLCVHNQPLHDLWTAAECAEKLDLVFVKTVQNTSHRRADLQDLRQRD